MKILLVDSEMRSGCSHLPLPFPRSSPRTPRETNAGRTDKRHVSLNRHLQKVHTGRSSRRSDRSLSRAITVLPEGEQPSDRFQNRFRDECV